MLRQLWRVLIGVVTMHYQSVFVLVDCSSYWPTWLTSTPCTSTLSISSSISLQWLSIMSNQNITTVILIRAKKKQRKHSGSKSSQRDFTQILVALCSRGISFSSHCYFAWRLWTRSRWLMIRESIWVIKKVLICQSWDSSWQVQLKSTWLSLIQPVKTAGSQTSPGLTLWRCQPSSHPSRDSMTCLLRISATGKRSTTVPTLRAWRINHGPSIARLKALK